MFFPAGDAIGQKIDFGAGGGYEKNKGEIVGVVGDVRHFGLDAPIAPTFYVPLSQAGMDGASLVIRAQASPAALGQPEIGRASCRERGVDLGGGRIIKKKKSRA